MAFANRSTHRHGYAKAETRMDTLARAGTLAMMEGRVYNLDTMDV